MGLPAVLFLIFLVLKLAGLIGMSWWWVTAPLWVELVLDVAALLVVGGAAGFVGVLARKVFRGGRR